MGQIEWAMWANEQAVVSSICLLMGGIIGVAGGFKNWQFAAFGLATSLVVMILEWPRSKRRKGNTIERKWQIYLTKMLNKMTPVSSNYYGRFVFHMILAIPCCFLLPTIMGAMSLMIAAIIYLVAAIKGEEWIPAGLDSPAVETTSGPAVVAPPQRPPPRAPVPATRAETTFNQI